MSVIRHVHGQMKSISFEHCFSQRKLKNEGVNSVQPPASKFTQGTSMCGVLCHVTRKQQHIFVLNAILRRLFIVRVCAQDK